MIEAPVSLAAEEKSSHGNVIMLSSFFIMMIAWGVNYSYGVFIKPLQAEFDWSRAVTATAFSLVILLRGVFHIFTGRLTDRFGPRAVVSVCTVFLGLSYVLMSQVNEVWQLYLFYGVVLAIGLSGDYVPLLSVVARWFTRKRGIATGIVTTGISVGTIVMPPVVERLISSYGWRTTFTITGVASFVLIMVAAQFLKPNPGRPDMKASNPGEAAVKSPEVSGLTGQQARRTRQFWLVMGIFPAQYFCAQFVLVHTAPLIIDRGISSIVAAGALTTIGLASLAGRLATGALSDRIGNKRGLILSTLLLAAALLWVLVADELWAIYLFAIMFGVAYGGVYTVISPLIADLFGLRSHGLILGITAFAGTIGGALGPAVAGYIFDATASYRMAFVISLVLCIVSLVLIWLLRPVAVKEEKDEPAAGA